MERLLYESKYDISGDSIEPVYEGDNVITAVFAPDNNFCKYFGVALQSLIENANSQYNYDIVVLDADIDQRNKRILQNMIPANFTLRFFDIGLYLEKGFKKLNLKINGPWSISTYYRLFIPMLMQKYNRVLYLDSDICINDNLSELFNIKTVNEKVVAVRDTVTYGKQIQNDFGIYVQETLKLHNPKNYFNAGVLLFNISNIDIENYTTKVLQAFKIKNLIYNDQCILNYVFDGGVLFVDAQWNLQIGVLANKYDHLYEMTDEDFKLFKQATKNPKIIHYTVAKKPWFNPEIEMGNIFWQYARKSPYCDEITYVILKSHIELLLNKSKIQRKYYFYKIFSKITFGNFRKKIIKKKDALHSALRRIRLISKDIDF